MSSNEITLKQKAKSYLKTPGSLLGHASGHALGDHYIYSVDIFDRVYSCTWRSVSEAFPFLHYIIIRKMLL